MKKLQTMLSQRLTNRRAGLSLMVLAGLIAFSIMVFANVKGAVDATSLFAVQGVQTAMTGEWTAEINRAKPGEVQLTFHRDSKEGGFNMTSETFALSELQGLAADAGGSTVKTTVNFNLVRDAGTFSCEGYFRDGRGAGFWTFTPSQAFVSAMRAHGYDNLSGEDLLRAAFHNLTVKFIEELKGVGYDHLTFDELVRAAGHDVTASYIREMRAAGYDGLAMEELIRARNHEIDSRYIKEVEAMGFGKGTLEDVIRLRNHEITPEYINDLKAEGYSEITADMAIRLKNHGIDRAFIQRVKAQGMTNVTLDELIRLRNHDTVK
jgi:uncharacterized protein (UPF0335 family)